MENLFNKIFPLKCIECGELGEIICDSCLYNSEILATQYCIYCDKPSFNGYTHLECIKKQKDIPIQTISIFKYENLIRDVIKTSKYGSKRFMALKKLSYEASYLIYELNFNFEKYICIPVPSSKSKYKYRGFNQAKIIADIISKKLNIPLDDSILTREKDTKAQFSLNKKDRFNNIKNAFKVNKDIKGINILIIDDVITTGSTIREISKVLYAAGAKKVKCLTVSKKFK